MDTLKLLSTTACAAFATDADGTILAWNQAAVDYLGHSADEVCGRACHDVLHGRDLFGNRFCDGSCTVHNMIRRGEPVRHFQMDVRHVSGKRLRAGLCTLVLPGDAANRYQIVHLLQPAFTAAAHAIDDLEAHDGAAAAESATAAVHARPGGQTSISLTSREMEVLRLLKDGVSTQNIADGLRISVTTVRNHIQGILRKLGAHSRLEAVSVARRVGIV